MKQSLENRLYFRCPIIYRGRNLGLNQNLMSFGFSCGDGWFQLIYDLSVIIEDYARRQKDEGVEMDCLPLVMQVKEKFGELRFYIDFIPDELDDLVEAACEKSATVCEVCGADEAKLYNDSWLKTRCADCYSNELEQ